MHAVFLNRVLHANGKSLHHSALIQENNLVDKFLFIL